MDFGHMDLFPKRRKKGKRKAEDRRNRSGNNRSWLGLPSGVSFILVNGYGWVNKLGF